MPLLEDLAAIAVEHVYAAGQTGVEAAHRSHDVDALEILGPVFFEDLEPLHRVLVRSRRAVAVARAGVPGRRWIRVIVCDLLVLDHDMMRKHPADRFVES